MTTPLLETLAILAAEAGRATLAHYRTPVAHQEKADKSPVTAADLASEAVILPGLAKHFPDIPVVSEEAASRGESPDLAERFFLVDPLDGTKEFLKGRQEFTVNIGLIDGGEPIAGAVLAPALGTLYLGERSVGAFKASYGEAMTGPRGALTPIRCAQAPAGDPRIVASRSHLDPATQAFIECTPHGGLVQTGSSLKFCLVAEDQADLYPRFGRTMEWDTAAGQAVLESAGGAVLCLDGTPLRYGKEDRGLDNPYFLAGVGPLEDAVARCRSVLPDRPDG
ncbi:MAG: 3'(2'),5'-bisphosphate nucleotidase CysQ [Pseudomonadota bacterium]